MIDLCVHIGARLAHFSMAVCMDMHVCMCLSCVRACMCMTVAGGASAPAQSCLWPQRHMAALASSYLPAPSSRLLSLILPASPGPGDFGQTESAVSPFPKVSQKVSDRGTG